MIIGHIPAGYITSRLLFPHLHTWGVGLRAFLWAGMLGALTPDLDMLYFHLVDQRQHHHHTYWSHYPAVWGSLLLMSITWALARRNSSGAALALIFSLNGFVHLLLDTIVGDIWWLAPFVDQPFSLFTVPALYQPWWLSFILHWTFALELTVVAAAVLMWRRTPSSRWAEQPATIHSRFIR